MQHETYLRHSMLKVLEQSPELYKKIYILGEPMGTNRGMALGREIATAIEEDKEIGDIVKDLVIAQLPKYELRDQQMFMELVAGKVKVPIRIQPDSCKKDLSAFYEYKTGAGPWTQKMVNESSQLTFYATGIYILTKKIPKIELIWAPTKKDEMGRPHLTGEIRRYPTTRTLLDIMKMKIRMKKSWVAIGNMVQSELL